MPNLKAPDQAPSVWQTLRIGGNALPGIIERAKVFGELEDTSVSTPGQDGTTKADPRLGDDTAEFELLCLSDPASNIQDLERIEAIRKVYKPTGGKPQPADVQHPLLQMWGIRRMFIQRLEAVYEKGKRNSLVVYITLKNNAPSKAPTQTPAPKTTTNTTTTTSTGADGKVTTTTTKTTKTSGAGGTTTNTTKTTSTKKPVVTTPAQTRAGATVDLPTDNTFTAVPPSNSVPGPKK